MNKIIEFATWLLEAAKCKLEKENNNAIGTRLEKIEDRLKSIEKTTQWQFLYIVGLALITLGVTASVLTSVSPSSILLLLIIGVVLIVLSPLIQRLTK